MDVGAGSGRSGNELGDVLAGEGSGGERGGGERVMVGAEGVVDGGGEAGEGDRIGGVERGLRGGGVAVCPFEGHGGLFGQG